MACAAAFIWSSVIVPETKGLSLEEIDVLFSSSAGQIDHRRRKQVSIVQISCSTLTHDISGLR